MNVTLIWSTPEPADVIGMGYGICTGRDMVDESSFQKWIAKGHETPLEHAVACFKVEGLSRVALAQLTRHRLASYSVQSHRYTEVEYEDYVVPDVTCGDHAAEIEGAWDAAWNAYSRLLEQGVKPETARYVLPQMATCDLMVTANFREWRHIIELRCGRRAQAEIRELAGKVLAVLHEECAPAFADLWAKYGGEE